MINKQALRLKVRIKKASKYYFLTEITINNLVRWVLKIDKITPKQRLFILIVFEDLRIRGTNKSIKNYEKDTAIYKKPIYRV